MPQNTNPAYRVAQLVEKAALRPSHLNPLQAWAGVFSFPEDDYEIYTFEILNMLGLLNDEVLLALSKMQASGYSESLYQRAFANTRIALEVGRLKASQWEEKQGALNPETRNALQFCSEVLPNEEELIPEEELAWLREQLGALREAVRDGSLPKEVKAFVLEQIGIIERAIRNYPIVGIKAFRTAIPQGLASIAENKEMVAELLGAEDVDEDTKQEFREHWATLKTIWGYVQTTAEKAGPWLAIVNAVQKAIDPGAN